MGLGFGEDQYFTLSDIIVDIYVKRLLLSDFLPDVNTTWVL